MSLLLNNIANDDFIWNAIASHLPNARRSNTAFQNFNCPICMDYKPRCGIKRDHRIGITCFNCGFTTGYKVGDYLGKKMAEFLQRIGVSDLEVKRIALHARAVKRAMEDSPAQVLATSAVEVSFEPRFEKMDLPEHSLTLAEWDDMGCREDDYLDVVSYALTRGDVLMAHADFRWSPDVPRRLIVPFKWQNRIVGYTARAIEEASDKYLNYMPQSFLFNNAAMENDRDYILLIEGPLDAIAVDGVSPLGSKLNAQQAAWLKSTGKKIIVVPDRDKAGDKMVTLARQHGWSVSFPGLKSNGLDWWESDIKDCDAAVKRYGRLYTLKSILETQTNQATEIEIKRKYLV